MKLISYPGYFNRLAYAEYGIATREDGWIQRIDIVVVNSKKAGPGTSLWYTQEGRDHLLNRILDTELKGVRVEFVRFFVLIDGGDSEHLRGMEYAIEVNLEDFIAKGNPVKKGRAAGRSLWGHLKFWAGFGEKTAAYCSRDVVAGCAAFLTNDAARRLLEAEELRSICTAVGYAGNREGMPTWMAPVLGNM